jgi:helicase
MKLENIKNLVHKEVYSIFEKDIEILRPAQEKAIKAGLFDNKNLLICTPTASGKTFIAELAFINSILKNNKKAIYIVPLKALASEKYKDFQKKYSHLIKISLSIGDLDSDDSYLKDYDLIICTSEKLDSLMRHHVPWVSQIGCIIIDEIHLINDVERGPTLEIIITLLKQLLNNVQLIGLSATIGNPLQLAQWLDAQLVEDNWRPVKLKQGIYDGYNINFKTQE